mmetsp:Transcript_13096/g.21806  ORF Transcript_13096/g.21806 Transcript_13096/m.21806 type:complete len:336 (-) Transcript_13096:377-1384(-)
MLRNLVEHALMHSLLDVIPNELLRRHPRVIATIEREFEEGVVDIDIKQVVVFFALPEPFAQRGTPLVVALACNFPDFFPRSARHRPLVQPPLAIGILHHLHLAFASSVSCERLFGRELTRIETSSDALHLLSGQSNGCNGRLERRNGVGTSCALGASSPHIAVTITAACCYVPVWQRSTRPQLLRMRQPLDTLAGLPIPHAQSPVFRTGEPLPSRHHTHLVHECGARMHDPQALTAQLPQTNGAVVRTGQEAEGFDKCQISNCVIVPIERPNASRPVPKFDRFVSRGSQHSIFLIANGQHAPDSRLVPFKSLHACLFCPHLSCFVDRRREECAAD